MQQHLLYLTVAAGEGGVYIPDEVIEEFIKLKYYTTKKWYLNETDEQLIILAYIHFYGWDMYSIFYNELYNKNAWREFLNKVNFKRSIR
jgi:hypothetical protein